MFTVLFQDYHLFAVKLAENISMDAEWDEKRVRGVLKEEGLEELADCLAEDFSGEFSREGRQFSGGQKQRIATGRVLYSSREVLVLDEPSAALDALAEAEFNSRIEKAAKERTVIFISHRLTSVRNADRIYVMEDGCITGEGKHEQLLKDNATYAKMWEIQTGAYK